MLWITIEQGKTRSSKLVFVVADIAVESDSDAVSKFGDGDMPADPGPRDVVDIHVTLAIREGLLCLDEIDLVPIFKRRACVHYERPLPRS